MKKYLLILLALSLSGCAPTNWNKPGATVEDFNRDDYACERDARMLPGNGLMDIAIQRSMYQRCMESKGWRKE